MVVGDLPEVPEVPNYKQGLCLAIFSDKIAPTICCAPNERPDLVMTLHKGALWTPCVEYY